MKNVTTDQEIPNLEWRRVTAIAWPALAVVSTLQAFLSEKEIRAWQIEFLLLNACALSISYFLHYKLSLKFAFTPVFFSLTLFPIVIGSEPSQSWVSLGLIILAGVIYFSAIVNTWIAVSLVLILSAAQVIIAFFEFESFSDNADLKLLNGYFSFVWVSILGLASIFIRKNYLKVAQSVEDLVASHLDKSLSRIRQASKINDQENSRLKLHGTFLNSLIFLRNSMATSEEVSKARELLRIEYENLANEETTKANSDFRFEVQKMVNQRTLKRIEVDIEDFSLPEITEDVQTKCIEIIREILLNFEKHTEVKWISIDVKTLRSEEVEILIKNDLPRSLPKNQRKDSVNGVFESATLRRIIQISQASLKSTLSKDKQLNLISVVMTKANEKKSLRESLALIRNVGLGDFATNYIRASTLVALLSLPGYLYMRLDPYVLATASILTIALVAMLVSKGSQAVNLLLGAFSLTLLPVLVLREEKCSQLVTMPWMFNLVLTVCFFFAINQNLSLARWIPLLGLSLQSSIIPLALPAECRNILLGSIPGIPLIIVSAFIVLRVRKKQLRDDMFSVFTAEQNDLRTFSTSNLQRRYFDSLLREMKSFVDSLDSPSPDLMVNVQNLILRIQNYLTCSPYFDSKLIGRLYQYFDLRYARGFEGRFTILSDFSDYDEEIEDWSSIVKNLDAILDKHNCDTTLLKTQSIDFVFESSIPVSLGADDITPISGVSFQIAIK